ncbi:binding-protein-dependent transport systems inner membrane component [Ignisphaera aggregans DSM 17230]|uniref:Binding-protein-dependent transport systems inner membrane component n=1 Tax=Ignisphaera aggregans (strain DSM 17230 / JCM 13409 / AQ1.S1) TaxID=583356 RepID=E0STU2_IGNAA|nr:binding-protein-dependent transport systems inner membrane component [Ignisphaera aggregans DSM 17230]
MEPTSTGAIIYIDRSYSYKILVLAIVTSYRSLVSYVDEIVDIAIRSILVSGTATILSSLWSLPLAYTAVVRPRLRILIPIMESLSGIPTVLIGLLLYLLLSRSGPLGFLNLLYTPYAIIIGQSILVTPLIIATSFGALRNVYEQYGELALSLGARKSQVMATVFRESFNMVIASIMIAFSRALGELGVALLVGGNIRWETRVFSTAIALYVEMGNFDYALKLGAILLAIEILLIVTIRLLRGMER